MVARHALFAVLISLLASHTAAQDTCESDAPFCEPEPSNVVNVTYVAKVTIIDLEEGRPKEPEKSIRIAVSNGNRGEPNISQADAASVKALGLETEEYDKKWYLVVKQPQDYENPNQIRYRFFVNLGGTQEDVVVNIKNVDDESPYFDMPDSTPCEVNESMTGQTTCFLLVYDPDAIMDGMTFKVQEKGEESKNISLILADGVNLCPATDQKTCRTVAINIINTIEFIDSPVHSLSLEVKDQAGHNGSITYIVQVIPENKAKPEFTPNELTIEINEETSGIVGNESTIITVSDPDALDYGQFTIDLDGTDDCYKAFDVIPRAGYRKTDVKLSVIEPKTLDYDKGTCNDFILKIKATEVADDSRVGEAKVNVRLKDLNDETPEFEKDTFEFEAPEHEVKGKVLGHVKATDKDASDKITYSLTSEVYLTIDPEDGSVKVNADFNYERQPQIFATVKAEDSNPSPHFAYAQIIVNIIDINDEKPVLDLATSSIAIEEVIKETAINTELTVDITATDEDSDPDLSFSIDWATSRAAKQGVYLKPELMEEWLIIETAKETGNVNSAKAVLKVGKIMHWEVFDTLYVNITVEDKNTEKGYEQNRFASATLTVTITDINDCYPEFSPIGNLTFKENTEEGQLFGIITATDADGPGFNEVNYKLTSQYEEEYVTIDPKSGELKTGKDPIDFEKIEEILYTVVASDGELETPKNITIQIEDVNDETPYFIGDYSKAVEVPENTNITTELLKMIAHDNDTSPKFNTISFKLEERYRGTFEINNITGLVYVPEGQGSKLDYENIQTYNIEITARDRCENEDFCYGDSLSNSTRITVQLLDENDNAPEIQNGGGILRIIAENEGKPGVNLGFVIAEDKDSGENKKVTFTIGNVTPPEGQRLFDMNRVDDQRASISVRNDLLDNWGEYTLTVVASDIGNLTDTAEFTIIVTDVNNHEPTFVYPNETTVIRFNIAGNSPGKLLTDVSGKKMIFSAIDEKDNGTNGTAGMTYEVTGGDIAKEYLRMSGDELWLIKDFDQNMEKTFKLQIKACDSNNDSNKLCTDIETQVIIRVNIEYEPTFEKWQWETSFTENKTGLTEVRTIDVPVTDLNNVEECKDTEACIKDEIYYFILYKESDIFSLESHSGKLSLKQELDREVQSVHTLIVFVTNHEDGQMKIPEANSTLNITIKVIDVIDTPPVFTKRLFAAGINIGDKINDLVTTITATDEDLEDELTYEIIPNSMTVTDSSLQNWVNKNPFKLENDNLRLNFEVQDNSLKGIFKFSVKVTDLEPSSDEAACQIYIISQDNLVSMRFQNDEATVDSKRKEIEDIYTEIFGYASNVKKVARALNTEGAPLEDQTDVTSYFTDEKKQEPINKDEITKALNNKNTYTELRNALLNKSLVLDSIEDTQPVTTDNIEDLLQTVLIVVSVVLGTLVVVLFAAFFIRTRSLNRRLEALSTTKFGSQDSGLNRIGLAVPNTNQHAVEGSNPIWGNEKVFDKNFDNVSQSSGDSDLIGVEDNPEFNPYGKSGLTNDGFSPEFETGRRASVNPMIASSFNPLSAAALQDSLSENTKVSKSVNPLLGMHNDDVYDFENDSARSSEISMNKNSNFTFHGRMDSMPITEL